ncbi:hypothetical protein [Gordonia sp. NB41Y]|uniref:hypothetical protein n=1 Tax=Gordonia sp. NB41Y TaxID=875808 RepID=UPI0002BD5904|nr:hypothetical protein [Gordonia sp. NB41Y]EMP14786.1 hypothetical protein ISGA_620 [Gordonia sp. NB41Y]WLP89113.1 hypothetical protein Q9K23_16070 [Gordonia sp. NB41Y]
MSTIPPAPAQFFAFGGDNARGYSTHGDVLVNKTADGVDLNVIWNEANQVMSAWNRKRTALAALISYPTIAVGDAIPQTIGGDHFEEASEYGEPQGIATAPDALIVGYNWRDWDLATRATWKFLRSATAEQVYDLVNRAMESDNRLITGTLLRRLFDPAPVLNEMGQTCYGLYTGTDGITPPSFAGQDFPASTSHYLVSGNTALDPGDLTDAINQVTSKGFGIDGASRLIVLCNPKEAEIISTFRAGQVTNSVESKYDFIPSNSSIPYLTSETVVGQIAPAEWSGLEVSGSYGPAWIVPSYFLPQGYIAVVATGGANSGVNPVAFRQHANSAYRGLRMIPGKDQRYPLQDSFFQRSFGTGVRYRGAACIVQVKASGAYEAPTWNWK